MAGWRFRVHRRDEKIRNPIQGEFFSEEAVERPAQALVREVVQNSLDARTTEEPVSLRFSVSSAEGMSGDAAAFWLAGAFDHLKAPDSGLRGVPAAPGPGRYLAIEDFGTTGLDGDPRALHPEETPSRLFAFFRAEGISQKGGKDGGRWGVGKTVFLRAGTLNTILCLTVRDGEPRRLVFGQSVLRYHHVNGVYYTPDGAFGEDDAGPGAGESAILPSDDAAHAERLIRDFGLSRRDEPGLSVVVPCASEEITGEAIADAVMREYFYPILTGRLTVAIDDPALPGGTKTLTEESLLQQLMESKDLSAAIKPLAALTVSLHHQGFDRALSLAPPKKGSPAWSDAMIPPGIRQDLAARYRAGDTLLLKVPLTVQPEGGEPAETHFHMVLRRDLTDRGAAPAFVRNGIQIPKALERRVRGQNLWALVLIEDRPLATLLGDAETPAHTHWSRDTQNFKGKYKYGSAVLEFVKTAPRFVAETLAEAARERDFLSLAEFFPLPEAGPARAAPSARLAAEAARDPSRPPAGLVPSGERYRIERLEGGFRIATGAKTPVLEPLTVLVAYDCTKGDPVRRFRPEDFDLAKLPRKVDGASIVSCEGNRLSLLPVGRMKLEVTGFDPNRDLFVKLLEGAPTEAEE